MLLEFLKIGSMYQIKDLYCIFDNSDIKYSIPDVDSCNTLLKTTAFDIRRDILNRTHKYDNLILKVKDITYLDSTISEIKFSVMDIKPHKASKLSDNDFTADSPGKRRAFYELTLDFISRFITQIELENKIGVEIHLKNEITKEILELKKWFIARLNYFCNTYKKIPPGSPTKTLTFGMCTSYSNYGLTSRSIKGRDLEELFNSCEYNVKQSIQDGIIDLFSFFGVDLEVQE